jgi:ribose transport system substrate-binding protein
VKRASTIVLIGIFLLFAFALSQSIGTMVSLSDAVGTDGVSENLPKRHVSVFLPDQATLFFEDLRNGVRSVADRYDLAVSFHPIGPDAAEFRLAQYSGIDGAVIYPYLPEREMRDELEDLEDADIPVVLVEQDVADDWPWTFVGTNNFEMGRRIGAQLGRKGPHQRIVVVYSEKSPAVASERELIELGITTVMGGSLDAPIMRRQTGRNPLDAEALTHRLLRESRNPPVTALVFTDTDDTLAALQAVINLNLVGEVQIIGFGVTEAILDYLDRGVLDATIAVNPQRIGIESMRVLSELMQTGNAPAYVDTGVEIVRETP